MLKDTVVFLHMGANLLDQEEKVFGSILCFRMDTPLLMVLGPRKPYLDFLDLSNERLVDRF